MQALSGQVSYLLGETFTTERHQILVWADSDAVPFEDGSQPLGPAARRQL